MKKFFYLILLFALTACQKQQITLTILHTNDTHSQVEPIAQGKSNGNCGGYARRMGMIAKQRQTDPDLLLFDGGDFCQGTPFFNFFKGRVEVDAMNEMGYDAGTLGNHEFDNGLDTLAMLVKRAKFPIVCANYDFSDSPLEGLIQPYTIINRKGLKIGVFGIGVNPEALIEDRLFRPLTYNDPIVTANEVAKYLHETESCDMIICLSHLGTEPKIDGDPACDVYLAQNSRNIDVIIGGHTHRVYLNRYETNLDGEEVLLSQMGKSGVNLGKMTVTLE